MNEDLLQPPKKSFGDHVHSVVRSGLGAIPIAGTASIELFSSIVTPPLEKRRDEWMRSIGERVHVLEERKEVDLSQLANNEAFITTMMHASQIAIRNHSSEKLEALKNAVSNSALPHAPDESKQLLFLNFVDSFTPWHMRLLYLFQDSRKWFELNGKKAPDFSISSSYSQILDAAYPELKNSRAFYDIIDRDLADKGLLSGGGMHTMMSAAGAYQKRTTEFGDEFLSFIGNNPTV